MSESNLSPRSREASRAWTAWQRDVVAALRRELAQIQPCIGMNDVDWDAWEPYFRQGLTANAAVDRALERGL